MTTNTRLSLVQRDYLLCLMLQERATLFEIEPPFDFVDWLPGNSMTHRAMREAGYTERDRSRALRTVISPAGQVALARQTPPDLNARVDPFRQLAERIARLRAAKFTAPEHGSDYARTFRLSGTDPEQARRLFEEWLPGAIKAEEGKVERVAQHKAGLDALDLIVADLLCDLRSDLYPRVPDFEVRNEGSLCIVRPMRWAARDWLRAHVAAEAQWFGGALAVEPRYLMDLLIGIDEAGFTVGGDAGVKSLTAR